MHNRHLTAYIEWQTGDKKKKGRKCLLKQFKVLSICLFPGIAVFDCTEGEVFCPVHIRAFFDVDKQ